MKNQKGFANIWLVVVLVVIIGGVVVWWGMNKMGEPTTPTTEVPTTQATTTPTQPTTISCADRHTLSPFIISVSPTSGPVGTKIQIKGCNLAGFEGDLDATFVRSDGKEIPLHGGTTNGSPTASDSDVTMVVTMQSYCLSGSDFGLSSGIFYSCTKVEATPGVYGVYVKTPEGKSNVATFTVSAPSQTQKITAYHYVSILEGGNVVSEGYETKEETVPTTPQVADASLKLLFATYLSAFKSEYINVTITQGVATASFKAGAHAYLDQAAAGVSDEYVKSIQKTLMQFPTVTKVQFMIDGKVVTDWDA